MAKQSGNGNQIKSTSFVDKTWVYQYTAPNWILDTRKQGANTDYNKSNDFVYFKSPNNYGVIPVISTGDLVINAGLGADQLILSVSSSTIADAFFTNLESFEVLKLVGSGNNTVNLGLEAADADIKEVTGSIGNDDIVFGNEFNSVDLRVDGGEGLDDITTADGDDTINGGAGNDIINGGGGNNTATYADSEAGVIVSLAAGAGTGTVTIEGEEEESDTVYVDQLTNIQNIIGSSYNDTLTGDANVNIIQGGVGADILTGGDGNDTFIYAAGDASVIGFADVGSTGSTALSPDAGDTFTGTEVIDGFFAGDILNLGSTVTADGGAVGTLELGEFMLVQGNYSSGVFTVGAGLNTGNDSLLLFDADSSTADVQQGAIVLLGVDSIDEAAISMVAGVMTYNVIPG